jgi:dTDP-4-dehydrorhamnose reductase
MKLLLLGCNGQVGWELQRALAPLGALTACDFDTPGDRRADFREPDIVRLGMSPLTTRFVDVHDGITAIAELLDG